MPPPTRPAAMRVDARQNRAKLLAAATELFAAAGPGVSLEAIAKRAGVGIGTLYRHFPTRDALVEAAYRNEVDQLSDAADELLDRHPADEAMARWMDRFVTHAAADGGMANALRSVVASRSDLYADARHQLRYAVATLLEAGVAAGSIRADVDADDVLRSMSAIWLLTDEPRWPARARKVLELLMDGLRHGAAG
jgi:AcrR family transcriptional regulator